MKVLPKLNNKIVQNFFSLSILQFVNMLIPLLLLPYIIRIVGIEKYGIIAFSYATIQFFIMFVEFGFNYSGTRSIAVNRNRINVIFNYVMKIKFIFLIISLMLLLILISFVDKFSDNYLIFLYTFGTVIGYALTPSWFFQGLERMKILAIVNIIVKVFFAWLIFLLVKEERDYYYVPLLQSLGFIISGLILTIYTIKKYAIKNVKLKKVKVFYYIRKSYNIFLSIGATSLYISANTLILGFTTNDTMVGYFNIAEKIARTARMLFNPFVQAIFPHLSNKFKKLSAVESINELKIITYTILPIILIGVILIIIFSTNILFIFGDENLVNSSANLDLQILSFILLFGTFNHIFGFLGLVNLNHEKEFKNYVLWSGIINIVLVIGLSTFFQDIGASIGVIITEVILFTLIFLRLRKVYYK
jgi:PST family polysaccharide transporter